MQWQASTGRMAAARPGGFSIAISVGQIPAPLTGHSADRLAKSARSKVGKTQLQIAAATPDGPSFSLRSSWSSFRLGALRLFGLD
jgi:hypothetical protein